MIDYKKRQKKYSLNYFHRFFNIKINFGKILFIMDELFDEEELVCFSNCINSFPYI